MEKVTHIVVEVEGRPVLVIDPVTGLLYIRNKTTWSPLHQVASKADTEKLYSMYGNPKKMVNYGRAGQ